LTSLTLRIAATDGPVFFMLDPNTVPIFGSGLFFVEGVVLTVLNAMLGPPPQVSQNLSPANTGLVTGVAVFLGAVAAVLLVPLGIGLAGVWCLRRARKSQVFQSDAIAATLSQYVDLPRIRMHVDHLLVAVSIARSYLEPFLRNIRRSPAPGPAMYETDEEHPRFGEDWATQYIDICQAHDKEEAIEQLRRSSAFPLAFSQGRSTTGDSVVDGGLADNVPYLPVLSNDVDTIVIVLLSPDPSLSAESIATTLASKWRHYRTPWLDPKDAVTIYRDHVKFKPIDDERWFPGRPTTKGKRFVVIGPAAPLASFPRLPLLTGTFNLGRAIRATWFQQGYADAMKILTAPDSPSAH